MTFHTCILLVLCVCGQDYVVAKMRKGLILVLKTLLYLMEINHNFPDMLYSAAPEVN
jgi:hypothetical protein